MYDTVKGSDWLGMFLVKQRNLSFYLQCSYVVYRLGACIKQITVSYELQQG